MIEYITTWLQLKTDHRAVTALEYGLIAAVMSVIILSSFGILATGLTKVMTGIAAKL